MIKLQLLLRCARPEPEVDPAVRTLLEAHGITVTCEGRASLSAAVTEQAFVRLFGQRQPDASDAARRFEAPALDVPASLADAISVITLAPSQATLTTSKK